MVTLFFGKFVYPLYKFYQIRVVKFFQGMERYLIIFNLIHSGTSRTLNTSKEGKQQKI